MCLFLWLSIRQKLMTDNGRTRRNLSLDPSYLARNNPHETDLHVLRDDPNVHRFWIDLLPASKVSNFFFLDLVPWLIWKRRDDETFNSLSRPLDSVFQHAYSWTCCFEIRPPKQAGPRRAGGWSRPPEGWFCLNCDGGVTSESSKGSAGGVLRDSNGTSIIGFSKHRGISSALQSELWEIYEGLRMAWDRRVTELEIQTENAQAVHLIQAADASTSSLSLIRAIAFWLNQT
ncbi:hypothetical protein F3Y22_tig00112383pilonHSYRG00357 [Hibiscus syriacus]|uniref:RNase H type-1 domain-containing protein n=1 Tax=Hibiscus syriacus TaxID=106335 RepID=A0A6A2X0E4_HIBSY|nr:hypothetical protein F3Y22_tig00112383pilonHSYRG00357 [Hibiscus syriacus]